MRAFQLMASASSLTIARAKPDETGNGDESDVADTGDEANTNAADVARNDDMEKLAVALADQIDANVDAARHMAEIVEAMETAKRGGIACLVETLIPVFGNDLREAGFPVPGSDADKFKVSRPTKDGQGEREMATTFCTELAYNSQTGKNAAAVIRNCNLALNEKTFANAPEEYQNLSADALQSRKAQAENVRTNLRRLYTLAVKVWYKVDEIETKMGDRIEVGFTMDGAELTRSAKAIWIADKNVKNKVMSMTATTFSALNVDAALAAGGSFASLIKTVSKKKNGTGAGQGGTDNSKAVPVIKNIDKLGEYASELLAYLDGSEDEPTSKRTGKVLERCSKDEAFCLTIGKLAQRLDDIYPEIEPAFLALQRQENRERMAEKKAKADNAKVA